MNTVPKTPPLLSVDKIIYFTLAVICVIFITTLWLLPIKQVVYFFSDDAYYYFKVAQNIVLGLGSTFDGTNLSNGYHPLWMLALLPIYALTIDSPEASLRLVLSLQVLLACGTLVLLWRYVSNMLSWRYALLSLIVFFFFASPVLLLFNGLESAMLIFWVVFLLYLDQKYDLLNETSALKVRLLLGFLLAVFMLIRLDSAFFIIALAIVKILFGRGMGVGILARLIYLVNLYWPTMAVFFVLISPYFIWNYLTFGHLSPISGTLKSTFPIPIVTLGNFGIHTLPYMVPFLAVCLWVFVSLLKSRSFLRSQVIVNWNDGAGYMMLFAIWFGCLIHVLWSKLFMGWGIYQWHFVSYIPVLVLGIVFLCYSIFLRYKILEKYGEITLLVVSALLVGLYNTFLVYEKGGHHSIRLEAAEWAQNVDKLDGFSLSDAGVFAYFNSHPTVNLDGLINSYAYQEHIVSGRLKEFLNDAGVRYIADAYTPCDYEDNHFIYVYAYRGRNRHNPTGYTYVANKNAEVYRSSPSKYRAVTAPQEKCFIIWDMNKVLSQRF